MDSETSSVREDPRTGKGAKEVSSTTNIVDTKGACCFQIQSRDVTAQESVETLEAVNVEFIDETTEETPAFAVDEKAIDTGIYDPSLDLATFLSRPVRIFTTTLAQGAAFATKTRIDPWSLFMGTQSIKNKLENYRYFRGDLHINVLVNSTPFVYGLYGLSYVPLVFAGQSYDPTDARSTDSNFVVSLTQRPTIFIKPHTNEGGTMRLPFVFHKNYATVQGTSRSLLGALDLYPIVSLASASTSTAGCSVSIYAWMENVSLAGPTLTLQGSEYQTGPISRPASIAAAAGRRLKDMPIIGTFAAATEAGMGAVAKIASLFGLTKVATAENVVVNRIMTTRGLASAQIADAHEKLAFDPKAELTVDNSAVGFAKDDELNVAHLCERAAVSTVVPWNQADAADFVVYTANVCPTMGTASTISSKSCLFDTPAGMVSRLFAQWRGTVVYKLKLIASQYHQGRLIVSFDPSGVDATADSESMVVTRIWDIQETDEMVFKVPFLSDTNFKGCNPNVSQDYSVRGATAITFSQQYHTGRLTIRVGNKLLGPVTTAQANIVVMTYMEDAEFANPRRILPNFTVMPIQAAEYDLAKAHTYDNESYRVNMGEIVHTLRTLLQRQYFYRRETLTFGAGLSRCTIIMPQYQVNYGYQTSNLGTLYADRAVNQAGTGSYNFWYSNENPMLWLAPCFVGQRGAMRWTVTVPGTGDIDLTMGRFNHNYFGFSAGAANNRVRTTTATIGTSVGANAQTALPGASTTANYVTPTEPGVTLSSTSVTPTVVAEIPYYSEFNFAPTGQNNIATSSTEDRARQVYISGLSEGAADTRVIDIYAGAGTDFSFCGFVNVPPRFDITDPAAI
nr:MAG: capsid protein [Chemarfal virus 274]